MLIKQWIVFLWGDSWWIEIMGFIEPTLVIVGLDIEHGISPRKMG
jgi:hypothetical protein